MLCNVHLMAKLQSTFWYGSPLHNKEYIKNKGESERELDEEDHKNKDNMKTDTLYTTQQQYAGTISYFFVCYSTNQEVERS